MLTSDAHGLTRSRVSTAELAREPPLTHCECAHTLAHSISTHVKGSGLRDRERRGGANLGVKMFKYIKVAREWLKPSKSEIKMGLLVNGKWVDDSQAPPNLKPRYTNKLGTAEFPFDPSKEPGRYHLYVSYSCPFAQRTNFIREFHDFDSAIGRSFVNPVNNAVEGWSFQKDDKAPYAGDQVLGKELLREVYLAADPEYTGRVSVPLLVDTKPGDHHLGGTGKIRIISAESADIVDELQKFAKPKQDADSEAAALGAGLMGSLFPAVRAKDEAERKEHLAALHSKLEKLDTTLSKQPYFGGESIGNADFKIFPFLVQVDSVSGIVFDNPPQLSEYPHLKAYAHRIYEEPSFQKNIRIETIHRGFYKMASRLGLKVVRDIDQLKTPAWIETS